MNRLYAVSSGMVRGLYGRYVDTPPVLDKARYFPAHRRFEEGFPAIRRECLALMEEIRAIPEFHELMKEQADLSQYGGKYWRMFVLRAYGVDNPANQARCPAVAALLKGRPEILSAT
ncbi:MAG TPA: aspartyl/asparaginyl beta-hydroxylase domain-containing protein, partial [Gammaproteobacteria bacterium]|nr:aspartyl/asparaginyl beta-hydroxylase domain-containing protein [Gammaproteobacteria bacterium]